MPEIRDIALSLIDPPEVLLGLDDRYEGLDELAADIRKNGLIYPIIVESSGDRYRVRDGMRRWHACKYLELVNVRCIVHGKDDPPAEEVKLKANLLRENNTDAEIAVWLMELVNKHNYSEEQLCTSVGRSASWVNARIALLRGDAAVLQALGERKITFTHAVVLNRCKDDALRAAGLHFAVADNIPAQKLGDWLQRNDKSGVPEGATLPPAPIVSQNGTEQEPGIICHFCGGHKDPFNMVQIWVHRWELEILQRGLQQGRSDA